MIQRYELEESQYGEGRSEGYMNEDSDGEYVKWDNIKDQVVWQTMTFKCRPKQKESCIVWQMPRVITAAVMYWELDNGIVKWRHHLNFDSYWSDEQINGSKWIQMLPNPWGQNKTNQGISI